MHDEILETARRAARAGAEVVSSYFGRASLEVEAKGQHDFVTEADRASERAIVEIIRERHPDHRILAEEGGEVGADESTMTWLVDPLDGTTNFLHGLPIFAVSIACAQGRRPLAAMVADPERGNEFSATRGGGAYWNGRPMRVSGREGLEGAFLATGYPFRARESIDTYLALFRAVFLRAKALRRPGAAALDLAYTAAGVYDGFFEFRLAPWDIGAGALLIEEAGGVVTDLDGGERYLTSGNVVAGSPAVHRDLLAEVAAITSEGHLDELSPEAGD